jgi:cytochrome c oxidase subunit 2
MRDAPKDAMEIKAIGKMWEWEFDYGDGKLSKKLVLPVNKPVRLNLVSIDVNHSLFIPAFRVMEDVVPGYDNYLWFTPLYVGEYEVLCTEYCGLLHSAMVTKAVVMTQDEYDLWLENLEATGLLPDHPGLVVIKNNGCTACHSLDGAKLVGPSFKGLYNVERVVLSGGNEITLTADDAYIKKAIYEPDVEIVKGYNRGLMKSYDKLITPDEINLIVEYLKTVNGE